MPTRGALRTRAKALGASKPELMSALDAEDAIAALQALIQAKEAKGELREEGQGGGGKAEEAVPQRPAAASGSGEVITTVTFGKTGEGFGMRMSTAGVVTGYSSEQSAAAVAGLPLGSTVVAVNGVGVGSKEDVKAQLRAAGSRPVEFTVVLAQGRVAEGVTPAPAAGRWRAESDPPVLPATSSSSSSDGADDDAISLTPERRRAAAEQSDAISLTPERRRAAAEQSGAPLMPETSDDETPRSLPGTPQKAARRPPPHSEPPAPVDEDDFAPGSNTMAESSGDETRQPTPGSPQRTGSGPKPGRAAPHREGDDAPASDESCAAGPSADDSSGYGFAGRTSSASSAARLSRSSSIARAPFAGPRPEAGTVRVVAREDLSRAVFVSYSRRHAGAVNLANVLVNCLRWHCRPDGTPYSRACRDGLVVPWMDKEQMVESGGADWSRILTEVQTRAFLSLFFLSNAYCGSEECLKELQYADMKKFERVPVFLEPFANDEAAFEANSVAKICDADMKQFENFEVARNIVERLTFRLQGVPVMMDLSAFTCKACAGERDTVCKQCTDWDSIVQRPYATKLDEMAAALGRFIDSAAIREGLLDASAAQPESELERELGSELESEPEPAPAPVHVMSEPTPEPWSLIVAGINIYTSDADSAGTELDSAPVAQVDNAESQTGAEVEFRTDWQHGGTGIVANGRVAVQTADRTSVWSRDQLPQSGVHYVEFVFSRPDRAMGASLGGDHFVGVVSHTDFELKELYQKSGAWGLVDLANDGSWADGRRVAPLHDGLSNEQGRCYGRGDRVGMLVNMDSQPRQLHFYRNDKFLEGLSVSGFPAGVYLCATPEECGVQVAISFATSPSNWREVAYREDIARETACREAAEAAAAAQRQVDVSQREASALALCEKQVTAAREAGRYVTQWSQELKGEAIQIESSLVAVQGRPAHTGFSTSVWGENQFPEEGLHYWEVCFTMDGAEEGASLGGKCFVGVVGHELKDLGNIGQLDGAYGFMDGPDDSLRVDGVSNGDTPPELRNSAGRCYGNSDRVGLLVDMDCRPHRLYIFRNGTQLTGCSVSGFPSGVRIAACPYKPNTKVTLGFPEAPFLEQEEEEDSTDSISPLARMRSSWSGSHATAAADASKRRLLQESSVKPEALDLQQLSIVNEDHLDTDETETEAEAVGMMPVDRQGWLEWTQTTQKGMVWKSRDVKTQRLWGEIQGTNLMLYTQEERSDRKRLGVLNLTDIEDVVRSKRQKDGSSFTISFPRGGHAPQTKLQTTVEACWDFTFKVDMEMSLNKWMQALADAQGPVKQWKACIVGFLDSSQDAFRADRSDEQRLVGGHEDAKHPSLALDGVRTSRSCEALSETASQPTSSAAVGASSVPDSLPSQMVAFSPEASSQLARVASDGPQPKSDEQAQKSARIRTQLAQELFLTERTYVKGLEMLIEEYMRPLQASANSDGKLGVSATQFRDIFSVVENILMVHQMQMLEQLEQKMGGRSGAPDLSVITVGDVFSDATLQTLKMHTSYANGYQKALDTLETCSKSKAFRKFCQGKMVDAAERGQNLQPLESYLITPIQRIMRYGMLLKELCKHTPATHPDKPLLDVALEAVEGLAQHVNESKRNSELRQKVQAVRQQFEPDGSPSSSWPSTLQLVGPSRQYIDEGELWDVDMGLHALTGQVANGLRRCKFFVFNDMLLKGEISASDVVDSAGPGSLAYRGAMLLSNETILRREVLHSPFLTPRSLLRPGSLQQEGITPWTTPHAQLHIIHVQAVSQAQIFDAQRASLTEYYEQVVKPSKGRGTGLRASRRSKTSVDECEELEKFVNTHMPAPAVEMDERGSTGSDDGSVGGSDGGDSISGELVGMETKTFVETGALREHQWEALCNRLESEYAERPQPVELGTEGGGATWCALKWILVCISEAECDTWFERLKKAVLWSSKVVEQHRREGASRQRLRTTQSMRSVSGISGLL